MKYPSVGHRGFTLVEVVVSLAVFIFCLVSLVGLFGVGLSSSRKSSDDTAIASMSSQIFDILRADATNSPGQVITYNFDADGQMTNAVSVYTCTANFYSPATKGLTNSADSSLLLAQLNFRWPAQAKAAPNTNVVNLAVPSAGSESP